MKLYKPWLQNLVNLKSSKLHFLSKNYPITQDELDNFDEIQKDESKRKQFQDEITFINTAVVPKKNEVREKKSDVELLYDFRFSNKYGQFLLERIKQKSDV